MMIPTIAIASTTIAIVLNSGIVALVPPPPPPPADDVALVPPPPPPPADDVALVPATTILKSVLSISCPVGRLPTALIVTKIVFGPGLLNVTCCDDVPLCAY